MTHIISSLSSVTYYNCDRHQLCKAPLLKPQKSPIDAVPHLDLGAPIDCSLMNKGLEKKRTYSFLKEDSSESKNVKTCFDFFASKDLKK